VFIPLDEGLEHVEAVGDEGSAISDAMRPIGVGDQRSSHRDKVKISAFQPREQWGEVVLGKLPSPRIISATELSSVIEPTVIVGFPVSFFVQVARFASVPSSPCQYLRWDRWNASTPAPARGGR
jgi:hypothetical protein